MVIGQVDRIEAKWKLTKRQCSDVAQMRPDQLLHRTTLQIECENDFLGIVHGDHVVRDGIECHFVNVVDDRIGLAITVPSKRLMFETNEAIANAQQ